MRFIHFLLEARLMRVQILIKSNESIDLMRFNQSLTLAIVKFVWTYLQET